MGLDSDIMPYVDMANVACGFHASDPQIMDKTVKLAVQNKVLVGAHPGYPDLLGFGRKNIYFSDAEIITMVLYQVGALQAICIANGTSVAYVKPHGALYNTMMAEERVMTAILKAMSMLQPSIPLMIMADSKSDNHSKSAAEYGVALLFEAFCDRAYTDAGALAPRSQAGAVFSSHDQIAEQVEDLVSRRQIKTVSGNYIDIKADTICVHGDNAFALSAVQHVRGLLSSL
jgi:UPF0271 protein